MTKPNPAPHWEADEDLKLIRARPTRWVFTAFDPALEQHKSILEQKKEELQETLQDKFDGILGPLGALQSNIETLQDRAEQAKGHLDEAKDLVSGGDDSGGNEDGDNEGGGGDGGGADTNSNDKAKGDGAQEGDGKSSETSQDATQTAESDEEPFTQDQARKGLQALIRSMAGQRVRSSPQRKAFGLDWQTLTARALLSEAEIGAELQGSQRLAAYYDLCVQLMTCEARYQLLVKHALDHGEAATLLTQDERDLADRMPAPQRPNGKPISFAAQAGTEPFTQDQRRLIRFLTPFVDRIIGTWDMANKADWSEIDALINEQGRSALRLYTKILTQTPKTRRETYIPARAAFTGLTDDMLERHFKKDGKSAEKITSLLSQFAFYEAMRNGLISTVSEAQGDVDPQTSPRNLTQLAVPKTSSDLFELLRLRLEYAIATKMGSDTTGVRKDLARAERLLEQAAQLLLTGDRGKVTDFRTFLYELQRMLLDHVDPHSEDIAALQADLEAKADVAAETSAELQNKGLAHLRKPLEGAMETSAAAQRAVLEKATAAQTVARQMKDRLARQVIAALKGAVPGLLARVCAAATPFLNLVMSAYDFGLAALRWRRWRHRKMKIKAAARVLGQQKLARMTCAGLNDLLRDAKRDAGIEALKAGAGLATSVASSAGVAFGIPLTLANGLTQAVQAVAQLVMRLKDMLDQVKLSTGLNRALTRGGGVATWEVVAQNPELTSYLPPKDTDLVEMYPDNLENGVFATDSFGQQLKQARLAFRDGVENAQEKLDEVKGLFDPLDADDEDEVDESDPAGPLGVDWPIDRWLGPATLKKTPFYSAEQRRALLDICRVASKCRKSIGLYAVPIPNLGVEGT